MSFVAFALSHGLIVGDVFPSERIRRCATELHPRSKNGAYFFNGDRGWVFSWGREAKPIWWNDKNAQPWTDAEKKEWAAKKRQEEQRREDGYRKAAATAAKMLNASKPAEHNYLRSKSLPDVMGLVSEDMELLVPMRNVINNELIGCQVIKWLMDEREWQKKMVYGMRAKGAVFRIGSRTAPETWIVEGYSTGLTLERVLRRLNLNAAVLICFSAGNIGHVAPLIKNRKFIFADNDKSGTGEAAAKAAGVPYCMSPVVGEDCNDMYARAGLLAVCKLVMEARQLETA